VTRELVVLGTASQVATDLTTVPVA